MVRFEDSVIKEEDLFAETGRSSVERRLAGAGWGRALLRRLKGRSLAASRAAARFAQLLPAAPTVVVIGGGVNAHGMETLYLDDEIQVFGFDLFCSELTHCIADGHYIPLEDASVDGIVIQAVLEHVLDPSQVVGEIHRVLKADGVVYAETAFMQQVHEGPYDFCRFTASGHRWLFRQFEEIDAGVAAGAGTQAAWTADYLMRAVCSSRRAGAAAAVAALPVRWLDRIVSGPYVVDTASAVYFLGRRSEVGLSPNEMGDYYGGAQR